MKITKASYGRTYSLGSFQSERIDLEATIDEGEDIQFVVCNLKHECDQVHQKNNPHLHQEQETTVWNSEVPNLGLQVTEPQEAIPSKKLSQEEVLAQLIEDATTLKALKWLEKPSEKYPQTKELYQNKLNQLTNATI